MARRAVAHKAVHRAAKRRPSTLAKVGALLAAPIPDVEMLIGAMANPDSGIKFVLGIAKKAGRRISEVQSVIFDKLKWTADAASQWLKENGFTGSGKDEGATFWRFRQQSPGKYKEFRTIVPGTRRNPSGINERVITYDRSGSPIEVHLTTAHSASSYGVPVAVIRGRAYGTGDRPFGKPLYVEVPSVALHPGGTISSDPDQPVVKGTLHERLMKFVRYPETDRAVNDWNSRVNESRQENPDVSNTISFLKQKFVSAYDAALKLLDDPTDSSRTRYAIAAKARDEAFAKYQAAAIAARRMRENPDVADAITSYDEHLGMTTQPEFQEARPDEQAAAMTAMDLSENPRYPASASVYVVSQDGLHQSFGEYTQEHLDAALQWAVKTARQESRPALVRVYSYYPGGKILRQERISPAGGAERQNPERNSFDDPTPSGWGVTMGRAHAGDVIAGNKPGRYMRLSDAALYNLARYFFDHNKEQWGFQDNHFTSFANSFKAGYRDRLEDYKRGHPGWERSPEANPTSDWPEEWKAKVETLLRDWHEAGRADFERSYHNLNYDQDSGKLVTYKQRWAMLDQKTGAGRSGAFMLDRESGNIYRIKSAYGVPNYKKLVGHISTVTGQDLYHRRWNPEDLGQLAFDAGKDFRLSGAYSETGVANARAAKYGFTKWYNNLSPAETKGKRKPTLLKNWMEGWAAGKRVEKKQGNPEPMGSGPMETRKLLLIDVKFTKSPEKLGRIIGVAREQGWPEVVEAAEAKAKRLKIRPETLEGHAAKIVPWRNPESEAAALYEDFHGKPPGETLEIVTDKLEHEWLTQLGLLVELKVATLTNLEATLSFEKDAPNLCSSEDGRQLYIEGGVQTLDLKALKMDGDKWLKDSMVIGVAYELTYQTEKGFQKFKLTDYFHKLGEETGVQPFLLYDPRNQLLSISGGQYQTKDIGIVN